MLDCLSSDRRVFPYFKHRFAVILLGLAAGRGRSVSELRSSALAPLLRKPLVAEHLRGKESVSDHVTQALWSGRLEHYVLTLALWGDPRPGKRRWHQLTRRGMNLVLQVNFSSEHDRAYERLLRIRDDGRHPFEWSAHPVNVSGRRTLAWVRLDVDLDEGEALVEEVQSDWVREARWMLEGLRQLNRWYGDCRRHWFFRSSERRSFADVETYVERVLEPHRSTWEEAALAAAIDLLVREVGVREIYYHTWTGGRVLKSMERELPPVSLYEKLPKRFCFERVHRSPRFLGRARGHGLRRRVSRVAKDHGFWFMRFPPRD